ncbi:hypothetical protein HDU96_001645 [Phlyctochytrium bullatum]|nr:hypothetical protein HDU96_001645 [Phlyctochytrium bullatum]
MARIPALAVTLLLELGVGAVIAYYDDTLKAHIIMAAFIPVLSAVSGCIGLQASAATLRGLVTGHASHTNFRDILRVLLKESFAAAVVGMIGGLALFTVSAIWGRSFKLAAVTGVSIGISSFLSSIFGSLSPVFWKTIGVDPAVAAGPLETAVQDVIGISITGKDRGTPSKPPSLHTVAIDPTPRQNLEMSSAYASWRNQPPTGMSGPPPLPPHRYSHDSAHPPQVQTLGRRAPPAPPVPPKHGFSSIHGSIRSNWSASLVSVTQVGNTNAAGPGSPDPTPTLPVPPRVANPVAVLHLPPSIKSTSNISPKLWAWVHGPDNRAPLQYPHGSGSNNDAGAEPGKSAFPLSVSTPVDLLRDSANLKRASNETRIVIEAVEASFADTDSDAATVVSPSAEGLDRLGGGDEFGAAQHVEVRRVARIVGPPQHLKEFALSLSSPSAVQNIAGSTYSSMREAAPAADGYGMNLEELRIPRQIRTRKPVMPSNFKDPEMSSPVRSQSVQAAPKPRPSFALAAAKPVPRFFVQLLEAKLKSTLAWTSVCCTVCVGNKVMTSGEIQLSSDGKRGSPLTCQPRFGFVLDVDFDGKDLPITIHLHHPAHVPVALPPNPEDDPTLRFSTESAPAEMPSRPRSPSVSSTRSLGVGANLQAAFSRFGLGLKKSPTTHSFHPGDPFPAQSGAATPSTLSRSPSIVSARGLAGAAATPGGMSHAPQPPSNSNAFQKLAASLIPSRREAAAAAAAEAALRSVEARWSIMGMEPEAPVRRQMKATLECTLVQPGMVGFNAKGKEMGTVVVQMGYILDEEFPPKPEIPLVEHEEMLNIQYCTEGRAPYMKRYWTILRGGVLEFYDNEYKQTKARAGTLPLRRHLRHVGVPPREVNCAPNCLELRFATPRDALAEVLDGERDAAGDGGVVADAVAQWRRAVVEEDDGFDGCVVRGDVAFVYGESREATEKWLEVIQPHVMA